MPRRIAPPSSHLGCASRSYERGPSLGRSTSSTPCPMGRETPPCGGDANPDDTACRESIGWLHSLGVRAPKKHYIGRNPARCGCTYPSASKLNCVNAGPLRPSRCVNREASFLIRSQNNLGNRPVEITGAARPNAVPVTAGATYQRGAWTTSAVRGMTRAKASRAARIRCSGEARTRCVTELGLLVYDFRPRARRPKGQRGLRGSVNDGLNVRERMAARGGTV